MPMPPGRASQRWNRCPKPRRPCFRANGRSRACRSAALLEAGYVMPGEELVDGKERHAALVRADGTLASR
jgi:hypothetical protein